MACLAVRKRALAHLNVVCRRCDRAATAAAAGVTVSLMRPIALQPLQSAAAAAAPAPVTVAATDAVSVFGEKSKREKRGRVRETVHRSE